MYKLMDWWTNAPPCVKTCVAACVQPSWGFPLWLTNCDVAEGVCPALCECLSVVAGRGWVGETAVQARYVVNSRKHSYYTFCCSVSPDSFSLSLPRTLPSASYSSSLPFLHLSVSCFVLSHTHTPSYVPVCMCSHSHTLYSLSLSLPSPSHRLPPLPLQSFPL